MARNGKKSRNRESNEVNQSLVRKVKSLTKENQRLKKMLGQKLSGLSDEEVETVEVFEAPVVEQKCFKCGSGVEEVSIGKFDGSSVTFLMCKNEDCKHSQKKDEND